MESKIVNQNSEILDIEKYADIERVDMTSPMSIKKYQQETLDEIDKLSDKFSPLFSAINKSNNNDDLEEMVKKINIFDTFAENDKKKEELAKEKEKEQKSITYALRKKVAKTFRRTLNEEDSTIKVATDIDIQRDFETNISNLSDVLGSRMGNLVNFMKLMQDFNGQLKVFIQKLERSVDIGKYDLENYENNFVKPLEAKKDLTPKEKSELSSAKANVYAMRLALQSLESQIASTYAKFEQDDLRSITALETMFDLENYRRITLSNLRSQAASIARTKQDQKDIAIYRNMIDASNDVLVRASEVANENIASVMEMSKDGALKLDTMKALEDNVKHGIQLLDDGYRDLESEMQAKSEYFEQFKKNRQTYDEKLSVIKVQREGIIGEEEKRQFINENRQYQKKLNKPGQ